MLLEEAVTLEFHERRAISPFRTINLVVGPRAATLGKKCDKTKGFSAAKARATADAVFRVVRSKAPCAEDRLLALTGNLG